MLVMSSGSVRSQNLFRWIRAKSLILSLGLALLSLVIMTTSGGLGLMSLMIL
jgi:hypothetical protein